jgi:hypothetical protein
MSAFYQTKHRGILAGCSMWTPGPIDVFVILLELRDTLISRGSSFDGGQHGKVEGKERFPLFHTLEYGLGPMSTFALHVQFRWRRFSCRLAPLADRTASHCKWSVSYLLYGLP